MVLSYEGTPMFTFMLAGEDSESIQQAQRRMIIVGVDDCAEAEAAAKWAVREAELHAVVSVAAEAQLLVVGTPYRGREWAPWIRSIASAVLERASCPVAIIPQEYPPLATAD